VTVPPRMTVTAIPARSHFVIQVGGSTLAGLLTEDEARELRDEINSWLRARQHHRRMRYWGAVVRRSAGWINHHHRNG